ncbi:MAG: hypothetical protein HQ495_00160 [Alphaproteobacteria bacterium]|nr:hypothetical protein [Alphaproteobacteria bacterium]
MLRHLKLTRVVVAVAVAVILAAMGTGSAVAGPLENLERERALMIRAWFDPSLDAETRGQALALSRQRLLTLERLVLRDDTLLGRNTPTVRRAFANYDLTFLIHASVEQDMAAVDTWFAQAGLTTATVMTARAGRR